MASDTWAQLVSITDHLSEPVEIQRKKFTIGRSKGADLSLSANKLVSGNHCYLEKDENGTVWLYDTSTNGTLVNMKKKLIGARMELFHGDEFYVVYRKAEPELNVAYMFQDMDTLRQEAEESSDQTQQYSLTDDLDLTAENSDGLIPEISGMLSGIAKWKSPETVSDNEGLAKKQKTEDEPDCVDCTPLEEKEPDEADATKPTSEKKAEDVTNVDKDVTPDAFEDSLICIICQEILHDCISCQPCMHSFCAGCYSDWMTRSQECPSCRVTVEKVNKNYIINNLVEAYLQLHPNKKRPDDELKALDARSQIVKNSFKPPPPKKSISEMIDEDDDENSDFADSSGDEDDDDDCEAVVALGTAGLSGFVVTNPFGVGVGLPTYQYKPPKTICRQCPDYKAPIIGLFAPGLTAVPETCDGSGGNYKCTPDQIHILCQCCLKPMPDRRREMDPKVPAQQCGICYRMYCHAYWGCSSQVPVHNCDGCLNNFKKLQFGNKILPSLILENPYESDILKHYLTKKTISVEDMVKICMDNLEDGTYTCPGISTETVVCYTCGLRQLRLLAYQYRKEIPNEELPDAVIARPNCHWGKNCRTQKSKMNHALNFNHVCEQTKF